MLQSQSDTNSPHKCVSFYTQLRSQSKKINLVLKRTNESKNP